MYVCSLASAQAVTIYTDLPQNPVPGKCYIRYVYPAEYQNMPTNKDLQDQLIYDTLYQIAYEPFVYDTVFEDIMIAEATEYYEWLPGDSVPFVVELNPITNEKATYFPPKYETITERKLLSKESIYWEIGRKNPHCLPSAREDCVVLCCVTVPARYVTLKQRKLVLPPKKIVQKNGEEISIFYPENVRFYRKTTMPAQIKRISKLMRSPIALKCTKNIVMCHIQQGAKLTQKSGICDWKEQACAIECIGGTNNHIRKIQEALVQKGYYCGEINNILNVTTRKALMQFQQDNELPVGKLDAQTLKLLGIR